VLRRIRSAIHSHGVPGFLFAIGRRLLSPRSRVFSELTVLAANGTGLEIGGPSIIFARGGLLPVYPRVRNLDNCNFGASRLWDENLREGRTFVFNRRRPAGTQFFLEATELFGIASGSYDFVLSSHTLEHIANPIQALHEWSRILKRNGTLVLVIPHRDGSFDHRRPVTTLAHLLEDFANQVTEEDLTHLPEVLQLHDLACDPGAGTKEEFERRCRENPRHRCLHHHVFDTRLAIELITHVGHRIRQVEALRPYHILIVAQKASQDARPANREFPLQTAQHFATSPFPSDRLDSHPGLNNYLIEDPG
jgi:SAM-dependent methyltransferase